MKLFKSKYESSVTKSRSQKVGRELHRIFSDIFSRENFYAFSGDKKPYFTITDVEVTPCLRHAKIFITECNNLEQNAILKYLADNSKNYRYQMAKSIRLKFIPEITFYYDHTWDKAMRIEEIFSRLN